MTRMPLPSRRRALEAGAAFIEAELHRMRELAVKHDEEASNSAAGLFPLTTSLEGDLMAVAEWASAAATLRALAAQEPA